jgi:hypothetical protein
VKLYSVLVYAKVGKLIRSARVPNGDVEASMLMKRSLEAGARYLGAESITEVNVLMNFPAPELNLLSQGIA